MSKPNRKQIERLMAEGVNSSATISKIQAHHEKKLAPLKQQLEAAISVAQSTYAEAAEQITAYKSAELAAAQARLAQIEAEIRKELELGISGNEVAVSVIEHAGAKASVEQTKQEATLEPKALLEAVPKAEQDEAFFACLKVQIQAARKYLGKKFEELASVKKHFAITIKWS